MAVRKPKTIPAKLAKLPTRVTYARGRVSMTKTKLAELAGMSPSQITRLEEGSVKEGIAAATLIRLADALGVNVGWLVADEGDPGPIPVFRDVGDKRRRKPDGDKGPR